MRFLLSLLIPFLTLMFWDKVFDVDRTKIPPELIKQIDEPVQGQTKRESIVTQQGHFDFLATYDITAKVLGREDYYFDAQRKVSPMDLALGWGPMALPGITKTISVKQSGRWYYYNWSDQPPISPEQIPIHSANVHIIPANDQVAKQLYRIKKYDIVRLKGYLVHYYRLRGNDGIKWGEWISSLTRQDTGAGSCEVLYVEEVTIY